MCLERRTRPVAAAAGVVAVVLCWSSAAWAGAISEYASLDPNTLSIPGESSVTAIPAPQDGDDHFDSFKTFSNADGEVAPGSGLMQLPIPATVRLSASSDDGDLAFPVDVPSSSDDRLTRFDFGRYPDAIISGMHDRRYLGAVEGAPVPEPAIVGGLLALALLAFITWRKRYG